MWSALNVRGESENHRAKLPKTVCHWSGAEITFALFCLRWSNTAVSNRLLHPDLSWEWSGLSGCDVNVLKGTNCGSGRSGHAILNCQIPSPKRYGQGLGKRCSCGFPVNSKTKNHGENLQSPVLNFTLILFYHLNGRIFTCFLFELSGRHLYVWQELKLGSPSWSRHFRSVTSNLNPESTRFASIRWSASDSQTFHKKNFPPKTGADEFWPQGFFLLETKNNKVACHLPWVSFDQLKTFALPPSHSVLSILPFSESLFEENRFYPCLTQHAQAHTKIRS